jgi:hypothetical protein
VLSVSEDADESGWSGILGADESVPGVAELRAFVGGGSVPTTDTQRPSR